MTEKMIALFVAIQMGSSKLRRGMEKSIQNFCTDEKGDTNFISIIIILAAVIALSGVFVKFGNKIIDQVKGVINDFSAPTFNDK